MESKSVMELATKEVKSISPRSTIMNALKTMVKANFRRMPIVEAGTKKVTGIVTATDLINFLGGGEKYNLIANRYSGNLAQAVNENIEEIMTKEVVCVRETDSWEAAVKLMIEKRVGGCPIVDKDQRICGIITERDILKFLATQKQIDGKVRDYMTTKVIAVSPSTTIEEAMKIMISNKLRRLPIIKDQKLLGLVVSRDFIRYFSKDAFKMLETGDIKDVLSKTIEEVSLNSDVLKYKEPLVFYTTAKISEVVEGMIERKVGGALIIENGALKGIITERDLVKFLYLNIK